MTKRIALVSTDGKVINQHFGHAEAFHVFDLTEEGWNFVETRTSPACCQDHEHTTARFDHVLTLLADCEAILAAQIGTGAAQYLESHGKKVFQAGGFIPDVLDELIRLRALDT